MKKRMKKILSVLLSAAMMVELTPVVEPTGQVWAAETVAVYNEDFETGTTLDKHGGGSGSHANQTEKKKEKDWCLKINSSGGSSLQTPGIALEEGKNYILSYRVKLSKESGSIYFRAVLQEWTDGKGDSYKTRTDITPDESVITETTDGWVTLEMPYTPEGGKNRVQFFFEEAYQGSAEILLDEITLKEAESGEAVYNENFDTTEALGVHSGNPTQTHEQAEILTDGNHYLEFQGVSSYAVKTSGIEVEAGKQYKLSYRVNVSNVKNEVYFFPWLQEWNVNGSGDDNYKINTEVAPAECRITAATDGWVTLEMQYTPTDGKNRVQFFFEQAASGGSADVWLDDIKLSEIEKVSGPEEGDTEEDSTIETNVAFNRVENNTWYLDAANISAITGSYYNAVVKVDGVERKIALEKNATGFVIWEGFFSAIEAGTSVPVSSLEIPEGTVCYQIDPNSSMSEPVAGGQEIKMTKDWKVVKLGESWYEYDIEDDQTGNPVYKNVDANVTLPTSGIYKNVEDGSILTAVPTESGTYDNSIVRTDVVENSTGYESSKADSATSIAFSLEKADETSWQFNMEGKITGIETPRYYKLSAVIDGSTTDVLIEIPANQTFFLIYPGYFTVYGGKAPTSSFEVKVGTELQPVDASKTDYPVMEDGTKLKLTRDFRLEVTRKLVHKRYILYKAGDINRDNTTDSRDLVAMKKLAAGSSDAVTDPVGRRAADVNISGAIDDRDLVAYRNALVGVTYLMKTNENMATFETSDADMTFFLNDFYKRHMGYVDEDGTDYSVTTVKPGLDSTNTFDQEWMSKTLFWFNSYSGLETDRYNGQKNTLESLPVDDYGYVWCYDDDVRDNASTEADGLHRMGWPFPTSVYYNSYGYSTSWTFNGDSESENSTGKTDGVDNSEWTSSFGATVDSVQKMMVGDFTEQSSISYEVTIPTNLSGITPYFAPWLELDLRMQLDNPENVDDVYVWFTNSCTEDFSEAKCVSAKEWAAINYEFTEDYQHLLYFPMYAHPSWGEWKNPEDDSHKIYKLKVEIRAKEGTTITGTCGLNSVRSDYDTRHANNNGIFLASLYEDFQSTGDVEYLLRNLAKARKAMNFYMQMYDSDRSLVYCSYLVGHDGDKSGEYENFNSKNDIEAQRAMERASALGNGYYDASYMPEYDFHTNTYFYKGLQSMIALEKYVEDNYAELSAKAAELNISLDKSEATIRTAERAKTKYNAKLDGEEVLGSSTYNYDSASLQEIADKVLVALREECNDDTMTGFWNTETGRFVAGYDVNTGALYDFGYTQYNTEAIYLDIATEEQSKSIMEWISGERIVESDKKDDNGTGNGTAGASGIGGSTGEDIYYFEFAPRITTKNQTSPTMLNGVVEADRINHLSKFGVDEVQFGGAFLFSSFYDIMARLDEYGEDNAYERLKGIQKWYNNIYDYFVSDEHQSFRNEEDDKYYTYFYHDYYYNHPFKNGNEDVYLMLQGGRYGTESDKGGNASGIMGIDSELVESVLLVATVPLGFFGLYGSEGKTLNITPSLPSELDYWKVENLMFSNVKYDLIILKDTIHIDSVHGDTEGLEVKITMDIKEGQSVYINGEKTDNYTRSEDGKAVITVPLESSTIQVR